MRQSRWGKPTNSGNKKGYTEHKVHSNNKHEQVLHRTQQHTLTDEARAKLRADTRAHRLS